MTTIMHGNRANSEYALCAIDEESQARGQQRTNKQVKRDILFDRRQRKLVRIGGTSAAAAHTHRRTRTSARYRQIVALRCRWVLLVG